MHNGDRSSGAQIARHVKKAVAALPPTVKTVFARADSGFYCLEAVEAYEQLGCQFILVARKTARLVNELKIAQWVPSPETNAAQQCEFFYQPPGWGKAYRFLALRYEKKPEVPERGPTTHQLGCVESNRPTSPATVYLWSWLNEALQILPGLREWRLLSC